MIKTVLLSSILAAVLGTGAALAQDATKTLEAFGQTFEVPAQAPAAPARQHRHAKAMALAGGAPQTAQSNTFQAFGHTFEYPGAR